MEKLQQLYHLLESNGVSSCLVDLELLSFGHLRGVGIHKEGQVDIIESIEYDNEGHPLHAIIRLYQGTKIIKSIILK